MLGSSLYGAPGGRSQQSWRTCLSSQLPSAVCSLVASQPRVTTWVAEEQVGEPERVPRLSRLTLISPVGRCVCSSGKARARAAPPALLGVRGTLQRATELSLSPVLLETEALRSCLKLSLGSSCSGPHVTVCKPFAF